MQDRGSLYIALLLITMGALFLAFQLVPGLTVGAAWPVIFLFIAGGFFLPAVLWPAQRSGLAGLYIPGAIMLTLGVIFLYNVITRDWASWAYAWLLIPGGVGLGLWMASAVGRWGPAVASVGVVMLLICVALFSIFGALFGGPILKAAGPIVIIGAGLFLLLRSLRRS